MPDAPNLPATGPAGEALPPGDGVQRLPDGRLRASHRRAPPCRAVWLIPVSADQGRWRPTDQDHAQWKRFDGADVVHESGIARLDFHLAAVQAVAVRSPLILALMLWPKRRITFGYLPVTDSPNPFQAELHAIHMAFLGQGLSGGSLASGLVRWSPPAPAPPAARTVTAVTTADVTPDGGKLCLHLMACLYPGGLFDRSAKPSGGVGAAQAAGGVDQPGPPDRALHRLYLRRKKLNFCTAVLMTGDQIYVDATAGLFDPSLADAPHARAYDRLASLDWRNEALTLAQRHALMDDHEVVDNWEPSVNRKRAAEACSVLWRGRWHFLARQRQMDLQSQGGQRPSRALWDDGADLSGWPIFLGDSRSERDDRLPLRLIDPRPGRSPSLMGREQLAKLQGYLLTRQTQGKRPLVATSAMLLPRRLITAQAPVGVRAQRMQGVAALRSDAWDGYPATLYQVLGFVAKKRIPGCVFLSGDEHLPCVAVVTLEELDRRGEVIADSQVVLHSIHAGALYAPYPFANARAEDFAATDTFEFENDGHWFRCGVKAQFGPTRDGFLEVVVPPIANGNGVTVKFLDALDSRCDCNWAF